MFLDREGRKVFEKTGWSEKLVEEFSWRVEALRGGGSRQAAMQCTTSCFSADFVAARGDFGRRRLEFPGKTTSG